MRAAPIRRSFPQVFPTGRHRMKTWIPLQAAAIQRGRTEMPAGWSARRVWGGSMQPVLPKPPGRVIPAKRIAPLQLGVRTHAPSNHARNATMSKDDRCAPWSIHWLQRRARAARNPLQQGENRALRPRNAMRGTKNAVSAAETAQDAATTRRAQGIVVTETMNRMWLFPTRRATSHRPLGGWEIVQGRTVIIGH